MTFTLKEFIVQSGKIKTVHGAAHRQKGNNNTTSELMKLGGIESKLFFRIQWYEKAKWYLLGQLKFKLALRVEIKNVGYVGDSNQEGEGRRKTPAVTVSYVLSIVSLSCKFSNLFLQDLYYYIYLLIRKQVQSS